MFTIIKLVSVGVRIWTQIFLIILYSCSLLGLSGGNAFIQRNSQMGEILDATEGWTGSGFGQLMSLNSNKRQVALSFLVESLIKILGKIGKLC